MISDGILIDGKHSFRDFGLCIADRSIGVPGKKSIRETVPFMNGYYDFTELNGAAAWEERELEYVFDIVGETVAEMDALRDRIHDWLLNVHEAVIHDDTMPNYHFIGSYKDGKSKEDGEKTELAVTFVCYPFKIYDAATEHELPAGTYTLNNPGQAVVPIVTATADMTIQIGSYQTGVTAGMETALGMNLERGDNTVVVTGSGTLTLSYYKEVL